MFPLHGEYTINVQNDILLVDATGPFNEELAKLYVQEYVQVIEKYRPKAQISTIRGSAIFSPEREAELIKLHEWSVNQGIKAEAIILKTDRPEENLFSLHVERSRQLTQAPVCVFDTQEAALQWIQGLAF